MLHKIQQEFIEGIFTANEDVMALVSEDGFLTPTQRLQIYKNNTRLALTELLIQTFPAVTKLVDERFMRYAAQEFWIQQRPESGDMNDYGAGFSIFLQNFPALSQHRYVADVARLEWLRHESWLSPIVQCPAAANSTLHLQPHVRLLQSSYPVADIWTFALEGGAPPKLDDGESFVLVHRADNNKVVVRRLDQPAHTLLSGFKGGGTAAVDSGYKKFLEECLYENIFTGVENDKK